ncbi:Gfo/Idh/MocA family oxidoreductase [Pantoea endophytica]|uniref:Gfo/Idh/MocA family protein n=1 Tax=Pantoea endophytica TaxID=92488 RepID=UPI00301AF286
MKLGIIGTGKIVRDVMQPITTSGINVVSILSTPRSVSVAETLADEWGIDKTYSDFESFFSSDIDTVYIATPNHLHYEHAKLAIKASKNVIIEKPIMTSIEEFNEIINLANHNNVMVLEAINIHFNPLIVSLQEDLKEIGDIKIVSLNYSQLSSRYSDFKKGIIHPAFDKEKAGGALIDINVYNLHFCATLFGSPEKSTYIANKEKNIDTSGVLILDYLGFKCICIGSKDSKNTERSSIQGDKGTIAFKSGMNNFSEYEVNLHNGKVYKRINTIESHRLSIQFREIKHIIENEKMDIVHKNIRRGEIVIKTLSECI